MRVDFNVPLADGKVVNANRIKASLPTINMALDNGAKSVVLISHLGRPAGKRQEQFSMRPVKAELEKHLGREVTFLNDCVGAEVEAACANPTPG